MIAIENRPFSSFSKSFSFAGNTRTGASAATDDTISEDSRPPPHSSSSPLVAHNAAFINELGGEEVRNVALTRATASKRVQQIIAGKCQVITGADIQLFKLLRFVFTGS